jgi:hypothetical protein
LGRETPDETQGDGADINLWVVIPLALVALLLLILAAVKVIPPKKK